MASNTILDPATYTANPLSIFTGCAAIYLLGLAIYRLYLAPQSKFPGPRLAALCYWYEFYYDVWPHEGQYTWKIRDLHEKYGMEAVFCHHVQVDSVVEDLSAAIILTGRRRSLCPHQPSRSPLQRSGFLQYPVCQLGEEKDRQDQLGCSTVVRSLGPTPTQNTRTLIKT